MATVTRINRRSVLALMGSSAVVACAPPPPVTQTERDPFEGGIGGTGIVGIMTDLGSVVINGLRVEVTGATQVSTEFGPASDSLLTPGLALTVAARRDRDATVADRIMIDYGLIGRIAGSGEALTVNGVPLRIEPGAIGGATPGARVAVSGVWARGGYVATRFDPVSPGSDLVAGTASRDGPTGLRISGVPITGGSADTPEDGQYAAAMGSYSGGAFNASRISVGRFRGASGLRQLSIEGFLEPTAGAPGFRVAGLGHSFAEDVRLSALSSSRALYFGPYDGLFRASAAYVLPERFADRRSLLGQGIDGGFDGQIVRTL